MADLNNLRITLSSDRKLQSIESDSFRIKLNGDTNDTYKKLFDVLGIRLQFEDSPLTLDAN